MGMNIFASESEPSAAVLSVLTAVRVIAFFFFSSTKVSDLMIKASVTHRGPASIHDSNPCTTASDQFIRRIANDRHPVRDEVSILPVPQAVRRVSTRRRV